MNELARIGDVADAIRGITFRGSQASSTPLSGTLPCLTTSAVYGDVRWSTARHIPNTLVTDEWRVLQSGDVLVSTANSKALVGRSALVRNIPYRATFGAFVTVLRPRDLIEPQYLAYWMQTAAFLREARALASQTTNIANLSVSDLLEMRLPLVSRSRQVLTTKVLTHQLEEVNLALGPGRERMKVVGDLRRRARDVAFGSLPVTAARSTPLRDVLEPRNEIVHPRDHPRGEGLFVGLEHVESGTGHRLGADLINLEDLAGRKARFWPGDIVYGYLRPYLNKVWLADMPGFSSVDQYVFKVDPRRDDPEFVAEFLRSSLYLSNAPIRITPGQLPRIRTEEVLGVHMPRPDLRTQARTAAELAKTVLLIDAIGKEIAAETSALEALPAALLRRAFGDVAA